MRWGTGEVNGMQRVAGLVRSPGRIRLMEERVLVFAQEEARFMRHLFVALWVLLWVSPPAVAQDTSAAIRQCTVGFGGDTAFGRYHKSQRYRPHGGTHPFRFLKPLLDKADATVVNLETPLMDGDPKKIREGKWPKSSLWFRSDTRYALKMAEAGVAGVSLANNHTEDCGKEAYRSTVDALTEAGVAHAGLQPDGDPYAPAVFEKAGTQFVLFSRSTKRNKGGIGAGNSHPTIAFETLSDVRKRGASRVKEARATYPDAVILFALHWGQEYQTTPSGSQRRAARALIDAGANAVLGHHAHVLQPVEVWNDGVIFYSLGNFLFDQYRAEARRSGFFFADFVQESQGWVVDRVRMVPLQAPLPPNPPGPATGKAANRILADFVEAAHDATPFVVVEGEAVWDRDKARGGKSSRETKGNELK